MRKGFIGFVLGAALVFVAVIVARQLAIHDVEYELQPQFERYVFAGPDFPKADFALGRTVHRLLFPTKFSVTYYDTAYHEVTHADKPGRYGAVVTMKVGVDVLHRFVTLYRTPAKISWPETPWPAPVSLPAVLGIDPAVPGNQAGQMGDMLKHGLAGSGDAAADWAVMLAGLSETLPGDPAAVSRTGAVGRDDAWWDGLREQLGLAPKYPYIVSLPHDYDADPAKRWPLIFYLTNGAEDGTDLKRVWQSSLGLVIKSGKQIPAVIIGPQCPLGERWNSKALAALLDEVTAKYRIDPDRVSVTGGDEVWIMAQAHPERFSAMLPIMGDTEPADAARLKDIPVWAFHGVGDLVTPISMTTDMLAAIRQAGGHTHLTIAKGDGDIWDEVYATEPIYPWLLAQKRGQPEVVVPGVPTE